MARIALLGNPNVGKSSLFNSLTGNRQKVANWPGKTIECKKGVCRVGKEKLEITDLPGTYSLTPFSDDEKVVEEALEKTEFDALVQIADSSNLERNLYLTLELLDKTDKLVVALNMSDVATKEGLEIDEEKLSKLLGVNFVRIDARDKKTLGPLLVKVAQVSKKRAKAKTARKASRVELVKGRYTLIQKAVDECVKKRKERQAKEWFDGIALHPIIGPMLFLLVMYTVFQLTFFLSEPLTQGVEYAWGLAAEFVAAGVHDIAFAPAWAASLIENGVIAGVGSVISFFPQIAVMMFLLYFLEDSGYLARVVVVLDGFLKRVGLGGKAFIPLLLGLGCNVPAILATRIVREEKTRLGAILSIPFMSCSARLPVYVLFAGVFFPGNEANVIFLMYILGFAIAIATALIVKKKLGNEEEELLIELPRYHWPFLKNVYLETRNSVESFAKRAGTIILAASIVIWFLSSAPYGVEYGSQESLAGALGGAVAPLFSPLGFSSWQSGLALLNGMVAKEVVISTLATTHGLGDETGLPEAIAAEFTAASALAFMVFVLLYVPCFAALGAIKSETGSWKTTALATAYYLLAAYAAALIAYAIASRVWGV